MQRKETLSCHYHAGDTESALDSPAIGERFDDAPPARRVAKALDGHDITAFNGPHGDYAGGYDFPVPEYRASSAFAFPACFLGTGKSKIFPQHINQTPQRIASN